MAKSSTWFLIIFLLGLAIATPLFSHAQKAKKIEILNANSLEYDETSGVRAKKLIGDLRFKSDSVLMYCDSAYLYDDRRLEAWGNVRINQGDTMNLYGDSLFYNSETKLARVRGDVRLINPDFTLTTRYLDFNRETDMAYYLGGGEIIGKKERNNLTSGIGYFYPKQNQFFFKDSVVLINEDYTIKSDTLQYNTNSEITRFFGPSTIESKDNFIYCENGWYDTRNERSEFVGNAWLETNKRRIEGDSIYYDRGKGFGEAFGNVSVVDTIQDVILEGEYTIYYEKDSTTLITGNALLKQLFDKDSLYLHADTLFATWDSTRTHRVLHAFHHVKFFKADMQGKCDSLVFSNADSTIQMFRAPIIWSDQNQITADSLTIKNHGGKIQWMKMNRNAFIVSQEDSTSFNQISGQNMLGHFTKNELRKVDVFGNGETIYFPIEKDEVFGMNVAECSDMIILIDSNQVQKITFLNSPKASLIPIEDVKQNERFLEGYAWQDSLRPRYKEDVFYWGPVPDSVKLAQDAAQLVADSLWREQKIKELDERNRIDSIPGIPKEIPRKPKGLKKDKMGKGNKNATAPDESNDEAIRKKKDKMGKKE